MSILGTLRSAGATIYLDEGRLAVRDATPEQIEQIKASRIEIIRRLKDEEAHFGEIIDALYISAKEAGDIKATLLVKQLDEAYIEGTHHLWLNNERRTELRESFQSIAGFPYALEGKELHEAVKRIMLRNEGAFA